MEWAARGSSFPDTKKNNQVIAAAGKRAERRTLAILSPVEANMRKVLRSYDECAITDLEREGTLEDGKEVSILCRSNGWRGSLQYYAGLLLSQFRERTLFGHRRS
jgi:hypothetical protein